MIVPETCWAIYHVLRDDYFKVSKQETSDKWVPNVYSRVKPFFKGHLFGHPNLFLEMGLSSHERLIYIALYFERAINLVPITQAVLSSECPVKRGFAVYLIRNLIEWKTGCPFTSVDCHKCNLEYT
jgi:hypothetical protein